ncbi:DMT family transporter [Prolixibacter denitrificans]|uniref:Drug/metabolite transporter 3 n=1 Tax=Prolixibacter denitrificans TaxID=1541063 RepID=A0A2P8CD04_9BACT|nr:DMT family transporter [Prolixibacter denitrificans]PSK82854.1 putative membrane protein [Prolixibacter denitrificans]GET21331.1 drug/metabolite transporter 3 [Prolixibacter denitrificans]
MHYIGEIAGIATAMFWTVTSMAFQVATRKVGSLNVNIIRLFLAFIFYVLYMRMSRGLWLPTDASPEAWKWLGISGLIGFVLGDFFLFQSYAFVSARISMLMMSLAPPVAALLGYIILGEQFTLLNTVGLLLVLTGIAMVILNRGDKNESNRRFKYPMKGILLAFGGAVGQGSGAVLSKFGMASYDAFSASQIRVIAGVLGFSLIFTLTRRWKGVFSTIKNVNAMKPILIGAFFGPFIGVGLSMVALQHTSAGIASTLMATVPVFILLPSVLFFGEKLTWREVLGAFITVGGIAVFFIR